MKFKKNYNLIILLFSILLGYLTVGLLNVNIPKNVPFSVQSIQEAILELDAQKKELEELKKLTQEKELQLERLRNLSGHEAEKALESELLKLKMASGNIGVEGPGIVIYMEDSNIDEEWATEFDYDVIHDADVLRIIGDLKNAGAEAISVNGQRILSVSEIKCGGPIIRVNGRSLATPFLIEAIGDPKLLNASINAPNTYAYGLQTIEKIKIETELVDKLQIAAYNGSFKYRYALPTKGGN